MIIQRAYKTEIRPNNVQRTLCMRHAGVSRFAYNWGLQRKQEIYRMNQLPVPHIKYPTAISLHRELNKLKKTDFYWMYETSKCAPQEALRDLDKAFTNFFKHRAGYPNLKSKKRGIGSFRLTGSIHVFKNKIQLPRLGVVRLKEKNYLLNNGAHILSATVSEKANRWFVSAQVEEDIEPPKNHGGVVGVDMACSDRLAMVSDGTEIKNPRALRKNERKRKRLQRELSRRIEWSNNRKKSRRKLQKIEIKIANIRRDTQHKTTTWLAKNKSAIVMEDLCVSGMLKNHNLAKSVSDAGMGEFYRQMEYKTVWYGSKLITVDRFYPSSKTCSKCGYIHENLQLSDRVFVCPLCDFTIDRDLNASVNLERFAISSMENENACGEERFMPLKSRCSPEKQELNTILGGVLNGQVLRNGYS